MREAVIVSTARTALAKSVRGSFNRTHPIVMAGHALRHAIARAGIEAAEVDDVILGSGMPGGPTGFNIARNAAIQAGCPVTTSGVTINRYRSSGLQAVAFAAGRVVNEGEAVVAAGGVESISLVQMSGRMNLHHAGEPGLAASRPALWMSMIETAEIVAERCGIGRFDVEIVPLATQWARADKTSGETTMVDVTVARDDCNSPETTYESLAALAPVLEDGRQ